MNGMDMLRVGVFEGSFAPVHNGHVAAAKAFMEQMKLDYLFVVPLYKKEESVSDSSLYRLKMCELAFADTDGVIISDMDILRKGGSTYENLKELRRDDARLFILMGTDEVLGLDKKREYKEIFKLCYPTYVRREQDPLLTSRIIAKLGEYYEKQGVMVRRIVTDPIEISSSDIRRRVRNGSSVSGLVPPSVEKFVYDNRLYLDEGAAVKDDK